MAEFIGATPLTTTTIGGAFSPALGFQERINKPVQTSSTLVLFTVTPDRRYRLITFRCRFTASAVVGTRGPIFQIVDADGNQYLQWRLNQQYTAGQVGDISISPVFSNTFLNTSAMLGFGVPDVFWPAGFTLQLVMGGFQAGDQFDLINGLLERLVVGQGGYDLGRQP